VARNSTVPVSKTEVYATTVDGQKQVDIKVFQGESRLVKNNVYLDQYTVDGVPKGPAGSQKVAVTFTYDINGILKVTTKIVSTGKEASMIVDKSPSRMTGAERSAAKERLDRELGPAAAPPPESEAALALINAARSKLPKVKGEQALRLTDLVTALERAVKSGDSESAARLDVELTELLFELD